MDFRPRRLGGGGRRGRLQARGRWSVRPWPSSRRLRVRLSSAWSISSCEQVGLSRVLAGPFMEACDFPRGLPRGLELLNPLPGRHGVDEGGAGPGATVKPCACRASWASPASEPRAGTAARMAAAGVPARVAMSREAVTARKSRIEGRQGTRTRSAARAAARAADSAWGAVSMRVSAAPCSRAVVRTSSRRSDAGPGTGPATDRRRTRPAAPRRTKAGPGPGSPPPTSPAAAPRPHRPRIRRPVQDPDVLLTGTDGRRRRPLFRWR